MNNKLFLALCLIELTGCSFFKSLYNNDECFGPNCNSEYTEYYVDDEDFSKAALPEICQNSGDPSLCAKDPFVNYTRTPADFRRYGERTPRDQRISQAGAGNNLSASIPPSIEDEVVAYQRKIHSDDDALIVKETKGSSPQKTKKASRAKGAGNSMSDLDLVIEDECVEEDDCVEENGYDDSVRDWFADEGQNLKALLTEWSERSGWRLVWNTNRNYVLSAGAVFRGRFADVSSALIRAFARARPAPVATFYNGNRVLVVETMEDENAYD